MIKVLATIDVLPLLEKLTAVPGTGYSFCSMLLNRFLLAAVTASSDSRLVQCTALPVDFQVYTLAAVPTYSCTVKLV